MNLLKLSKQQIDKLVSGLVEADENQEDAFARSVWSLITEPGDTFAAALIDTLGAAQALAAELNQINHNKYIKLLNSNGISGAASDRFRNFESLLTDARQRWQPRLKLNSVENMLNLARVSKAKLVVPGNEYWPEQLNDLELGKPHCLWLRGNLKSLGATNFSLAVVGSRLASSYGDWVTSEIVSECASNSIAVVSGGAYGIDATAHRSALALGVQTIAIMAGGVDRLYPSGNSDLLRRVMQSGAVIAEQAPGSNPTRWRFLQRNRLIAALASATVVVEAGRRSGAINTAMHADTLARPLAVIPGPISSPTSAGCHALIKNDSARIAGSVADVIDLVTGNSQPALFEEDLGALEKRALDAMNNRDSEEQNIAMRAGLTNRELNSALGRLQLLGLVVQGQRGWRKVT